MTFLKIILQLYCSMSLAQSNTKASLPTNLLAGGLPIEIQRGYPKWRAIFYDTAGNEIVTNIDHSVIRYAPIGGIPDTNPLAQLGLEWIHKTHKNKDHIVFSDVLLQVYANVKNAKFKTDLRAAALFSPILNLLLLPTYVGINQSISRRIDEQTYRYMIRHEIEHAGSSALIVMSSGIFAARPWLTKADIRTGLIEDDFSLVFALRSKHFFFKFMNDFVQANSNRPRPILENLRPEDFFVFLDKFIRPGSLDKKSLECQKWASFALTYMYSLRSYFGEKYIIGYRPGFIKRNAPWLTGTDPELNNYMKYLLNPDELHQNCVDYHSSEPGSHIWENSNFSPESKEILFRACGKYKGRMSEHMQKVRSYLQIAASQCKGLVKDADPRYPSL